ncbi:hypothetical protein ABZ885_41805, partial [Kitasatospora sp. NPDC047058]
KTEPDPAVRRRPSGERHRANHDVAAPEPGATPLDYAAPEQISGHPVDGRCDQYSLGCVVFEMLAATPPFRRESDLALLWAHLNDPPSALRELRPDLSDAVDAAVYRALAKEPARRYANCLEFVTELRAAIAGAAATAVVPADPWQSGGPPTQVVASGRPSAPSSPTSPPVVPEPPLWAAPVVHPPPR